MSFRIAIFDGGEWLTRAEGREAESLIRGLDTFKVLQHLADGTPLSAADFRAVISPTGEIHYLGTTEAAAAQMIQPDDGHRIVPARIQLAEVAPDLVITKR